MIYELKVSLESKVVTKEPPLPRQLVSLNRGAAFVLSFVLILMDVASHIGKQKLGASTLGFDADIMICRNWQVLASVDWVVNVQWVARAGIQPLDADVGKWLRKLAPHVRVKVLLNKSEGFHDDSSGALMAAMGEAHSLGFGAPVAVSAETGQGLLELYGDLRPWVERAQEELLAKRAGILLLIFPFLQIYQ